MDRKKIEEDFKFLEEDEAVLAVLLFGSQVTGETHERSDIDICIVDLTEEGEVLGIEILNASQNLPFTKQELKNIQELQLNVEERNNTKTISIQINYSTGNKGKISFGYPETIKT